jgi:hypothetical protein
VHGVPELGRDAANVDESDTLAAVVGTVQVNSLETQKDLDTFVPRHEIHQKQNSIA